MKKRKIYRTFKLDKTSNDDFSIFKHISLCPDFFYRSWSFLLTVWNKFRPGTGSLVGVEGPFPTVIRSFRGPLTLGVVGVMHTLVVPVAVVRMGLEKSIIVSRATSTSRTDPAFSWSC